MKKYVDMYVANQPKTNIFGGVKIKSNQNKLSELELIEQVELLVEVLLERRCTAIGNGYYGHADQIREFLNSLKGQESSKNLEELKKFIIDMML